MEQELLSKLSQLNLDINSATVQQAIHEYIKYKYFETVFVCAVMVVLIIGLGIFLYKIFND